MGEIQAKIGKIPTSDDALQEMLSDYKKKAKKFILAASKRQLL
jgi:hypothetical protein